MKLNKNINYIPRGGGVVPRGSHKPEAPVQFRPPQHTKSFTFIEVLSSIFILGILISVLIIVLKPSTIFAYLRDKKRLHDLNLLEFSIKSAYLENPELFLSLATNTIYISLPDESPFCSKWLSKLPPLPSGWYYKCSNDPTNITSGWLPLNLSKIGLFSLKKLPIDPINNENFYYSFVISNNGFEITSRLEKEIGPDSIAGNDDGDNLYFYEVGTDKKAMPQMAQRDPYLVLYWSFDEGSGFYAYDYSGNQQTGVLRNFREVISDMESLSNWYEPNYYITLDSINKISGNFSLKLDLENNQPLPNTTYTISYIPPSPIDFSNAYDVAYYLNYNTSTNYISSARLIIYDQNNNYRYWNIGVNRYWRLYSYSLSYYSGQTPIPPNLSSIAKIEFQFKTGSSVGPFYINLDLLAFTKDTSPRWVDGRVGKAIEFDGIDDYVYFYTTSSIFMQFNNSNTSMTSCFWLKRYRTLIWEIPLRRDPNEFWWVSISSSNNWIYFYTAGSTAIRTDLPNVLDRINIWYHLCVVYDVNQSDGYRSKIYLNGQLVARGNPVRASGGTYSSFSIGARTDGALAFKGVIDEVKIYNKALTSDEILHLYQSY